MNYNLVIQHSRLLRQGNTGRTLYGESEVIEKTHEPGIELRSYAKFFAGARQENANLADIVQQLKKEQTVGSPLDRSLHS